MYELIIHRTIIINYYKKKRINEKIGNNPLKLESAECWHSKDNPDASNIGSAKTTNAWCVEHVLLYTVALINSALFLTFLIFNWRA